MAVIFVDETEGINATLLKALEEYTGRPSQQSLKRLLAAAKARKAKLAAAMKSNPATVLKRALADADRKRFPPEAEPFLEKRVVLRGSLTVLIADNFTEGFSTITYLLMPEDAHPPFDYRSAISLRFVPIGPQLLSSSVVELRGVQMDREVAVPINEPDAFKVHYIAQPPMLRLQDDDSGGSSSGDDQSKGVEK